MDSTPSTSRSLALRLSAILALAGVVLAALPEAAALVAEFAAAIEAGSLCWFAGEASPAPEPEVYAIAVAGVGALALGLGRRPPGGGPG